MAFGQAAGPAASAKQVDQLRTLLAAAGHIDFRDARGPLGLNQRQAAGRFTRDEAAELIERLEAETSESDLPLPTVPSAPLSGARTKPSLTRLHKVPTEELAAELQRRGWVVLEP